MRALFTDAPRELQAAGEAAARAEARAAEAEGRAEAAELALHAPFDEEAKEGDVPRATCLRCGSGCLTEECVLTLFRLNFCIFKSRRLL